VGAGGNVGSVLAGFLFKGSMPWTQALLVLGAAVSVVSVLSMVVRFSSEEEDSAEREIRARLMSEEQPGELAVSGAMGD
jgi:NNP family nitrate/nitrite transporter-like MFS transporter